MNGFLDDVPTPETSSDYVGKRNSIRHLLASDIAERTLQNLLQLEKDPGER
jgi:hypothetical protein